MNQTILNMIKAMGLTNDQIGGWVRALLGPVVIAGMLWLAQKGLLPVDQANVIAPMITGAVASFVMGLWSSYTNSEPVKKASVAAMTSPAGGQVLVIETMPSASKMGIPREDAKPIAAIAEAIAKTDGVAKVITTPIIAATAPSAKVVSNETVVTK